MNVNWYSKKYPIYRDARQLMIEIETAVRHFLCYHQYTLDSELRRLSGDLRASVSHAHHQDIRLQWVKKSTAKAMNWRVKFKRMLSDRKILKTGIISTQIKEMHHNHLTLIRNDEDMLCRDVA